MTERRLARKKRNSLARLINAMKNTSRCIILTRS